MINSDLSGKGLSIQGYITFIEDLLMKAIVLVFMSFLLFRADSIFAQVPNYIPKDSLVGWWPFNGNANDESGKGHNGMVNGPVLTMDRNGEINKAYSFDGIDDFIATLNPLITGSKPFTFSFWAKTTSKKSMEVLSQGDFNATINWHYCGGTPLIGPQGLSFKSGNHWATAAYTTTDSSWHMYTIVGGTNKSTTFGRTKLYIDGKLMGLSCGHNWGGWSYSFPDSPFTMGKKINSNFFNGQLDDIAVWERALDSNEISNIYNKSLSKCIPNDGLVGWWPFNGNANDESGNGNHGTSLNSMLSSDRFGQPNSAYYFNGNDSRIDVPASTSFDLPELSISLWILADSSIAMQKLIGKTDWTNPNLETFALCLYNDSIRFDTRFNSNCISNVGWSPKLNVATEFDFNKNWHHIVVTYDKMNSRLFLDGKLIQESNNTQPIDICTGGQLRFGAWYNIEPSWFKGFLDDIGVWNRALTPSEVDNLYKCNKTIPISECTYTIKESDTTICPGTSLTLNTIQTSATKSVIPQEGLVGFWPFNGNANDESGKGNNGIVNGSALSEDRCDQANKSYLFDGNDWIEIGNSNTLRSISKQISISSWFRINSWDSINSTNWFPILSKSKSESEYGSFRLGIINVNDTNIVYCNLNSDAFGAEIKKDLLNNGWNHILVTMDDSLSLSSVYLNGILVRSGTNNYSGWKTNDTLPLIFGMDKPGITDYTKGNLDDISIWNRILTNEEIQKVYGNNQCGCDDTLSNDIFVWSDGQKGRTITVRPDTSTTYMLTVTDGTTIHRDSIRVTIGGDSCFTCTYAIHEQDTTICQGTTLQLHADLSDTTNADIPKEGLIGYWPFNGNANDESGNGNHGIVDKATLTSDKNNKPNSAYQFYKSGSKIAVPDAKMLNNPFVSISFWLKTQDTLLQSYIYKSQEGTAKHEEYGIVSNFTRKNTLEFSVKNGSNCIPASGWKRNIKDIVVFDGYWHHITATYDGIFSKLYIDTVLVSEIQDTFFPIDSCPGGEILFGKGWNNDANFDGILDDIAIWNRAITFEEVKSMYKVSKPKYNTKIPQDGLIGFWPFNGNAQDQSSLANHGEVNGATLTTDRCEKRNSAYEFNGIDNYIEVKNSASLSNVESVTMSAWINLDSMRNSEQGITTKWYQIQDCTRNTDAYTMILSKIPTTNNQTRLVGGTIQYVGRDILSEDTISESKWLHVAFTHNSLIGGKIYINGLLNDSISKVGSICNSTNPLYFGADNYVGKMFRFFQGKIDDIAIWNRALSDNEIVEVYNAGSCDCLDTLAEDKFTWSTGEKGRTISVKPDKSTMYTLAVERGKVIDRDTIHVTVLESPTPDIFGHIKVYERQVNHSYYTPLNDSSTYEWSITGNGKLSSTNGGSSILVDFKEPGYAYLTVTETNKYGCKKDTTITIRIYRLTDVSESEIHAYRLQVYPNPISESNAVQVRAFIPPTTHASISLIDLLGKELQSIQLEGQDAYQEASIPVSIEGLPNGVYMIQLQVNGDILSKKLIINR
jgi:hypothetical protein